MHYHLPLNADTSNSSECAWQTLSTCCDIARYLLILYVHLGCNQLHKRNVDLKGFACATYVSHVPDVWLCFEGLCEEAVAEGFSDRSEAEGFSELREAEGCSEGLRARSESLAVLMMRRGKPG